MPLPTSLTAVIRSLIIRADEDKFQMLPCVVEQYIPATHTVNVRVAVKAVKRSEDGSPVYFELPVISDVKIGAFRSGGFIMSMPCNVGDEGFLLFSTLDTGQWESTGQVPSEPDNLLRNALSSCVFLPQWSTDINPVDPSALALLGRQAGLVLGEEGGLQLRISPAAIELGSESISMKALARADKVADVLRTIMNAFNAHVHAPGSPPTIDFAHNIPLSTVGLEASVSADKVKGE